MPRPRNGNPPAGVDEAVPRVHSGQFSGGPGVERASGIRRPLQRAVVADHHDPVG